MPALPQMESQVGYVPTGQPFAEAGQATRPFDIFAAGMRDVASHFSVAAARLQAAQQVSDAADIQARVGMELVDLRRRFQEDQDPATVPQRAREELAAYRDKLLKDIPDNGVRGYVDRHLSQAVPSFYAAVTADAGQRQKQALRGRLQDQVDTQARLLMTAANDADHTLAMQGLKATLLGHVTTGLIDDREANTLFSHAMRNVVTSRAATDPAAAQALLDRYKDEIQPQDIAALTSHLRAPLERQQALTAAQTVIRGTGALAASTSDIYQGLINRGMAPEAAWAWTANAVAESQGNTGAIGDGGISHGLFQWNRERAQAFVARYGHLPSAGTLDEQLDFVTQELAGSEARARDLIDQARGPADKAAAISRYYLRPRDVNGEATRRAALATQLAGGAGRPTLGVQLDQVQRLTRDAPLQVQLHAEGLVRQQWSDDQAAMAPLIQQTRHQVGELMARYEGGMTDTDIPEDRIRAMLPPQDAAHAIEQLRIARAAGDMFRAVAAATPEEEAQMRAALAVPGAVAGNLPRREGRTVLPAPGQAQEAPESEGGTRLRLAQAQKLDELLRRKHAALAADPAAYVAGLPMMQSRAQALDQTNPQQARDLIAANLAVQEHLGVRPDQRRVLTNDAVAQIVERLHGLDPATGDAGMELTALAARFGNDPQGQEMWRRAFGELVARGKLSPDYQVLAAMYGGDKDTPGQAGGRADFQRALRFRAQKGGMEQLAHAAPPDERRKIDQGIDETLADFRATTAFSQGGPDLFSAVRDSVRTLAYFYAYQGQSGGRALEAAYERVLGDRYDFDGTMRVPKGKLDEVRNAARAAQVNLSEADIGQPPADPSRPWETAQERRTAMLQAARSGFWMPNHDDSGLILMARLRNGQMVVRRVDGTPVSISFGALPSSDIPGLPATDPMGTPIPGPGTR